MVWGTIYVRLLFGSGGGGGGGYGGRYMFVCYLVVVGVVVGMGDDICSFVIW